jgi:IS5 family transposase
MAHRRIGQERRRFGGGRANPASALDEMAKLIDWAENARCLGNVYAAPKGEPSWPPLALFQVLLLATWRDLSDVKLAEALADRASFGGFYGFSTSEPTPERAAFVRFRAELVERGLDRLLFETVTWQLRARGVAVPRGTLVDASLIPSASVEHGAEARWAGHRRRKPVHGYKAHIATDQDAVLIDAVEVTTANVHDAARLDEILPAEPGEVFADSAFAGRNAEGVIIAHGGTPRAVQTGVWGNAEALERLQVQNVEVRRVRARIEKVFGTAKRSYGLRRMRWLGLAKAGLQVRLAAMAYNIRRCFGASVAAAAWTKARCLSKVTCRFPIRSVAPGNRLGGAPATSTSHAKSSLFNAQTHPRTGLITRSPCSIRQ